MSLRSTIRKAIERYSGLHIYKNPPRGADIFFDLNQDLPDLAITTIFDVGANIGQSADEFLKAFPTAAIHCFEPVISTFRTLQANVGHASRITTHHTALGSSVGTDAMTLEGPSSMFRLASANGGCADARSVQRDGSRDGRYARQFLYDERHP